MISHGTGKILCFKLNGNDIALKIFHFAGSNSTSFRKWSNFAVDTNINHMMSPITTIANKALGMRLMHVFIYTIG